MRIIRQDCIFESGVVFGKTCYFEGRNFIGENTTVRNSRFGYGSYTSRNCFISSAIIGKYCCIGPNVNMAIGKHPTSNFVSTHPFFYSKNTPMNYSYVSIDKFQEYGTSKKDNFSIAIGNDVWIGANVTILDGINIGDGAIIAAGSVVNKDVEAYSIVGGVPAKEIRKRFPEETILKLQKIKWWNYSEDFLINNADCFDNIDEFIKRFNK